MNYKILLANILSFTAILFFGRFVYAQVGGGALINTDTTNNNTTTNYSRNNGLLPTVDVKYQEPDDGSYWVDNVRHQEINGLNSQSRVLNLRIPVLLGVAVNNLTDTWGDARSNGRTHEGIDIISPRGDFIVSPTDAVVTTVANGGLGGNHVFTANPGGERYYFAHLDSFAPGLMEGQVLKAGDLIGYVGNTGNAAGGPTHLHFGIYEDNGPGESTTGSGAVNPYPRLTLAFTLQDKMGDIIKYLAASLDPTTLARSLTGQYKNTFIDAQASSIALPPLIAQVLTEKKVEALGITRTLQLGSHGDDVKWLQGALGLTADGSFGPKTKAAVISFQIKKGLVADGVFGAKSRALLAVSSTVDITRPAGCTSSTVYSPTTGVKC